MKQFKAQYLIILFYEIVGWCYANKQLPRKLDIWVEDEGKGLFVANVYHYPDRQQSQVNGQETQLKEPEKEQGNPERDYLDKEINNFRNRVKAENNQRIQAMNDFTLQEIQKKK